MQYRVRRTGRIAALTLASALVASACGGGSSGDGKDDDASTTVPQVEQDAGKPVPGGTLTYALEAESSGGYCLATAQLAAGGIQVAQSIYDQLFVFDENFEPQPYLAESYSWNDEYNALTINLREGVVFHDGSALTADVVKLNVDTWRADADAVAKTGLNSLLFRFVYENIDSVTVDGPLTLTINTKTPWIALPEFLAGGRNGIMAEAQMMGGEDNCKENLIGTGPFKYVSWTVGSEMRLAKNENYWRTDADGNKLPYLDELIYKPVIGGQERITALESGTVDAGHFSGQSEFDAVNANSDLYLTGEAEGHREIGYGLVNNAKAPTDDLENRRHLSMAIDRDILNDINSNGEFDVANQPFDFNVIGYVEDIEEFEYDPDTAADFFEGKNLSVEVLYTTDPVVKALADEVKAQLEEVGVTVNLQGVDQPTLINTALGGNYNIMLFRNHPGADPDTQYNWWHSKSIVNFGKINDPEIDRLLEEGRASTDQAERKTIYEDMNRAFAKGGYNQWNWYTEWGIGTSNRAHNLTGTTLPDGSPTASMTWGWHLLTEAWVDQ